MGNELYNKNLQENLIKLINNPYDDRNNFNLGYEYDLIGHTAIAISYYLRSAEYTKNEDISYECMLKISKCLSKQGSRDEKELACIEHAISINPQRPEAYYIMSLYHSYRRNWLKSYMYACIGLQYKESEKRLIKDIGYFDIYQLLFQKAYSGFNKGKINESKNIYYELLRYHKINHHYRELINKNIKFIINNKPNDINKVKDIYQYYDLIYDIWGWCTEKKSSKIIEIIKNINRENIKCVEIGVYGGKSILPLAIELKNKNDNSIIYAIDSWKTEDSVSGYSDENYEWWSKVDLEKYYRIFQNLVEDFDLKNVITKRQNSCDVNIEEMGEIDYIYIDGQHTEKNLTHDIEKFGERIKKDGYMLLDDIDWFNDKFIKSLKEKLIMMNFNLKEVIEENKNILWILQRDNYEKEILNKNIPELIVIDNFYKDPESIRRRALDLEFLSEENHGAVGFRCEKDSLLTDEAKRYFEKIFNKKIKNDTNIGGWNYSTNGCFQWCPKDTRIVYHCDTQEYAGIVFLTPDAPVKCGTSIFRHKKYKIKDNSIFNKKDWFARVDEPFTDPEPWEEVDRIGNIYNRLVLFKSHNVHGVTEYFGEKIENSRLFQLFFFDLED